MTLKDNAAILQTLFTDFGQFFFKVEMQVLLL